MSNWIVGGIVFLFLGLVAWQVIRVHRRGGCSGCCSHCRGCRGAR